MDSRSFNRRLCHDQIRFLSGIKGYFNIRKQLEAISNYMQNIWLYIWEPKNISLKKLLICENL